MGLMSTEAKVKWNYGNRIYYLNKGYVFTKWGDEFLVNVKDLTDSNGARVDVQCDECNKIYNIRWVNYKNQIIDNKCYCKKCVARLFTGNKIALAKNNYSFKDWCVDNCRIDLLDLWDCKLNELNPYEVSYASNKKFWFKCPRALHKSSYKSIQTFTRNINYIFKCDECNSIGQWLLDNYGDNAIEKYWSKKNTINPFHINYASKTKVWIICDRCGYEKLIYFYSYIHDYLSCPRCSDGTSYPNKLAFSLLEQLHIDFIKEYTPEWIKPKRYDFYFRFENKEYIVEMDGALGHGKSTTIDGKSKEETQEIDDFKDKMANEHNIEVIRINCDISDLYFIKNNILNSKLSNIFDLNKIDWLKCDEYARNSLVTEVCELWNSGIKDIKYICKLLNIGQTSARRYLTKGTNIGLCKYKTTNSKSVYCIELAKIFSSIMEAERETNIAHSSISKCCQNKANTSGGYHWMYYDDYLKLSKKVS